MTPAGVACATRVTRALAAGVVIVQVALLCACSSKAPERLAPSASAQSASRSPASAAPSVTASLSHCPAPRLLASLPVLARLEGSPDDIAVAPSGAIWVSVHDAGRLDELSPSGQVVRSVADAHGPEGIVALGDGRLLVAQQGPDRIDLFDPVTASFQSWLQLQPARGVEGVDGLGSDGTDVLVPDSARGRLLRVPLQRGDAAGTPQLLASGLGRPVDAAPLGGGVYAVALENSPGLVRVVISTPGGDVTPLAHLSSMDDVRVRHGLVYATNLAQGQLDAVDPESGALRVLVSGSPQPQGLALLPDGRELLVDETRGVVVAVPGCG